MAAGVPYLRLCCPAPSTGLSGPLPACSLPAMAKRAVSSAERQPAEEEGPAEVAPSVPPTASADHVAPASGVELVLFNIGREVLGQMQAHDFATAREQRAKRADKKTIAAIGYRNALIVGLVVAGGAIVLCLYALHQNKDWIVADILKIALGALGGFGAGVVQRQKKR